MIDCKDCKAYCCKNVGTIIAATIGSDFHKEVKEEYSKFPYSIKKDGSCEKLVDNKCSIYSTRPTMCNTDALYKKFAKLSSYEDYKNEILNNCNSFKKEFGNS